MKKLLCMALVGAATATIAQTSATSTPTVTVRTAASSPVATGASENFTGTVRVSAPFQALPPGRSSGGTVSFEARARTAWHTHPLGQTLIITDGLGLVQQQGQPALVIRPGDVATIPANVRHWHGAGPDGPMTHVAIAEREDGNSVTWGDKVSDADYLAAVAGAGLAAGGAQGLRTPARAWPTSDTLSAQQRAIPLIAAFVAASDMPKLNAALNQGLDAGMTLSEAKEVLVQLYAYAGFPKSLNALGELMKVVQARQQRWHPGCAGARTRPCHSNRRRTARSRRGQSEQDFRRASQERGDGLRAGHQPVPPGAPVRRHLRARQPRLAEPRTSHRWGAGRNARRGGAVALTYARQFARGPDGHAVASVDSGTGRTRRHAGGQACE